MSYLHGSLSSCHNNMEEIYLAGLQQARVMQKYLAFSSGKFKTAYVYKVKVIFISEKYFEFVFIIRYLEKIWPFLSVTHLTYFNVCVLYLKK